MNGDIYIDNGNANGRVEKWTLNATSGIPVMNISKPFGSFIDTTDTLVLFLGDLNMVKTCSQARFDYTDTSLVMVQLTDNDTT
jgi:hypothetical protein